MQSRVRPAAARRRFCVRRRIWAHMMAWCRWMLAHKHARAAMAPSNPPRPRQTRMVGGVGGRPLYRSGRRQTNYRSVAVSGQPRRGVGLDASHVVAGRTDRPLGFCGDGRRRDDPTPTTGRRTVNRLSTEARQTVLDRRRAHDRAIDASRGGVKNIVCGVLPLWTELALWSR